MTYDDNTEEFVFKNGRREYANRGIIGLSVELNVYEGYDGSFSHDPLPDDEAIELADYMIYLWTQYRNRHETRRLVRP